MCVHTQASEYLDLSGRLLVDTESPLLQAGRTVSDTPPKDQEATVVCIINCGLHQPQISSVQSQDWQSPFPNSLPLMSLNKTPSPVSECTCARIGTLHLRQNSGSTTAHRRIICPKSIYLNVCIFPHTCAFVCVLLACLSLQIAFQLLGHSMLH